MRQGNGHYFIKSFINLEKQENNKVLNSNTTNVALQRMRYKNKQILQGFRGIYRSLIDTNQNEHNINYHVKKRFLDHHDSNKLELAYNHRA